MKSLTRLESVYLMNVVLYFDTVSCCSKFIFINKKCADAVCGLKRNPFSSDIDFYYNLSLFPGIQTLSFKLEDVTKQLEVEFENYHNFNVTLHLNNQNKFLNKIKKRITRLHLKVEYFNLNFKFKDLTQLRFLRVTCRGGTGHVSSKVKKSVMESLNTLPYLQAIVVEFHGNVVSSILSFLEGIDTTRIKVTLKIDFLTSKHLFDMRNIIKHNITIACYESENRLCFDVVLLQNSNNQFSVANNFLFSEKSHQLYQLYYPSLTIQFPPHLTELNVDFSNSLHSLCNITDIPLQNLTISSCHFLTYIDLPYTLSRLRIHSCGGLDLHAIEHFQLQEMFISWCGQIEELSVPRSVTHLEVDNCICFNGITTQPNIQLRSLRVLGCKNLTTLKIPKRLNYLYLVNCAELSELHNIHTANLLDFSAYCCPLLQELQLPKSLVSLKFTKCGNVNVINLPDLHSLPKETITHIMYLGIVSRLNIIIFAAVATIIIVLISFIIVSIPSSPLSSSYNNYDQLHL
ncbi:Uncharacterized protein QTN25_001570 [Entamoeba marina]